MRVRSLYLPAFKNLREFKIEFEDTAPLAVLVGRNGTGKSNVIEALTVIFRDLDLGLSTPFSYRLEYTCRNHLVLLEYEAGDGERRCELDGQPAPFSRIQGDTGRAYRPDHVFGY